MRARYRAPTSQGIVELSDDATVQDLFDALRAQSGINSFTLKYGPPMAMKNLDLAQAAENAKSLGLHGESLTIVPLESAHNKPADTPMKDAGDAADKPEEVVVPWPEREGTLRKSICGQISVRRQLKVSRSSSGHAQ